VKKGILLIFSYFFYLKRKIMKQYFNVNILDDIALVNKIKNERISIARFGDGEFRIMIHEKGNGFQEYSENLRGRLLEVFKSRETKLFIGIPKIFNSDDEFTFKAKSFWAIFINESFVPLKQLLESQNLYCNASITRPYMDYKDKSQAYKKFRVLMSIWENKDVVIIEGDRTFFGVGNDLLGNTSSIARIICPSVNSFDKYEMIIKETTQIVKKDSLILIALGPTATILAYDLSKLGYQVLDIGHLDIEYEWSKQLATEKVVVKNKQVNEVNHLKTDEKGSQKIESNIEDLSFEKSVLIRIK